jgi:hypothetical protein
MITLALNILDIVQNSLRAKADHIMVEIEESASDDTYRITITDNGSGIPPEIIEDVTDAFVTTRKRRRFGLGLPLLKHHAEITGGGIDISSEEGKGTCVRADFSRSHLDRQPLGDIGGVMKILMAANPAIRFSYRHRTEGGEYTFSTGETMKYLGVSTLNEPDLLEDIEGMINENLREINASGVEYEKAV